MRQPGAITVTTSGATSAPRPATRQSTTMAAPVTARTRRPNASGPSRVSVSVKTGTTAVDSAPSARSRRSRFGMRKATKNASVSGPAPKTRATTMSRTKPSTRLASVASPIEPTALTTPRWTCS